LGAARTGLWRNDGARTRCAVDHHRRQHRLGGSFESVAFHRGLCNAEFCITKLDAYSHTDAVGGGSLGFNRIGRP
jgi:hypothetical protein